MRSCALLLPLVALPALLAVAPPPAKDRRVQEFSADPGWEGHRNRLVSDPPRTRQDFGHRATRRAGGAKAGEVGGWVQRSLTPASYAKKIPAKTLNDKLTASGRFAVTKDAGGSGVLFGWFHESSRGWRTPNSVAFRLDGNGGKYWVLFEYGTRNWRTGGGATFEGRYQTTKTKPFLADGTSHQWSLTYDPKGDGELLFTLDGKTYKAPLAPGHKADGATFNRFGVWNQQNSGSGMEVYFDDLVLDGVAEDFGKDPGWVGVGNEVEFKDRAVHPKHDFGHSRTRHAGGKLGEVGGLIWRNEAPAYYADKVGPLTLNDELYASGKIAFRGAGSDSGVYFGWFEASSKKNKKTPDHQDPPQNILAVLLEGPSRAGHYFRPSYRTARGRGVTKRTGPTIRPDGRVHTWSLRYSPAGAGGNGRITVTFDDDVQTLDLEAGHKRLGASFDRFGLFNVQSGGHQVVVYLDDLTYTAKPAGVK